jgi:hypothetical protein
MTRSAVAACLAAAGVFCIFGGEALCIAGPIRYEDEVHLVCHTIFYVGMACVGVAGVAHWSSRRKRGGARS